MIGSKPGAIYSLSDSDRCVYQTVTGASWQMQVYGNPTCGRQADNACVEINNAQNACNANAVQS